MAQPFENVAIIARRQDRSISDTVLAVTEVVRSLGANVFYEDQTAAALPTINGASVLPRKNLAKASDLVVVVGGDGSMLGVSRDISDAGVPIVGVNRGGLGFLAAVSPERLQQEFSAIWRGEFSLEEHFLLHAEVYRAGQLLHASNALNDVVVHAGSTARMLEFELLVDDEFVYEQRSDGVIVASPTGSTAYSLSAGGPIMHPSLDAIAIVPMFPHTLTSRPLVVKGKARLCIRLLQSKYTGQLSCDSQVNMPLEKGDEVHVRKSDAPLRLVYPQGHSFYESCRSKLDWGSRLGGGVR